MKTTLVQQTLLVSISLSLIVACIAILAAPAQQPQPQPLSQTDKQQESLDEFYKDQPHLVGKPSNNTSNSQTDNKTDSDNNNSAQSNSQVSTLQFLFNQLPKQVQTQLLNLPGFAEGLQMALVLSQFGQFNLPGTSPSGWIDMLGDYELPIRKNTTSPIMPNGV